MDLYLHFEAWCLSNEDREGKILSAIHWIRGRVDITVSLLSVENRCYNSCYWDTYGLYETPVISNTSSNSDRRELW
jgi:hypothetical protein